MSIICAIIGFSSKCDFVVSITDDKGWVYLTPEVRKTEIDGQEGPPREEGGVVLFNPNWGRFQSYLRPFYPADLLEGYGRPKVLLGRQTLRR